MSKLFLGPLIVLLALGLALGAWFFLRTPVSTDQPSGNAAPVLPIAETTSVSGGVTPTGGLSASSSSLSLPTTVDGFFIIARDFTADSEIVSDPNNPQILYLAGMATTSPFSISYTTTNGLFSMLLRAEPLGPVRAEASQKLLDILQISQSEACNLIIDVEIASSTNSFYEGKYIGLPFCEWSTALPQ